MHRHTEWMHRKGRVHADVYNEKMKQYQKTFSGNFALMAGHINTAAKKRFVHGKVSSDDLIRIWAKQNDIELSMHVKCASCSQKTDEWHVDHIVPLRKGGKHARENLQFICRPCHSAKTRQDRDAYVTEQSLFDLP